MAAKIKKGDSIVVLSGRDKGKQGVVARAMPSQDKVLVTGINLITKHIKPSQTNPRGGREQREAPLHVSNVALQDPKTGLATRVRFETRDGKKVRVAVKSGEVIHG
jgi:large subunit ribosomal protein L24